MSSHKNIRHIFRRFVGREISVQENGLSVMFAQDYDRDVQEMRGVAQEHDLELRFHFNTIGSVKKGRHNRVHVLIAKGGDKKYRVREFHVA